MKKVLISILLILATVLTMCGCELGKRQTLQINGTEITQFQIIYAAASEDDHAKGIAKDLGERLLIPSCMLRHGENVFLDDLTTDDVSARLGVPVVIVPGTAQGLLDAVAGRL